MMCYTKQGGELMHVVLPALLQKPVGDIFYFWDRNFAGNLAGNFP